MTRNPEVSVIMGVFDRPELIPRAMNSIINQDFEDFEFLVINDGSGQEALDVVHSIRDPRIRVVTLPVNTGIPTGRNIGARMSRGQFIAAMDSDDFATPDRLAKQCAFLRANPDVHFLGSRAVRISQAEQVTLDYRTDDGFIKAHLVSLIAAGMLHPTSMMRADFLRAHDLQYPMERTDHDHALWIEAMIRGAKFANLPDVLLHYYRHETNATAEGGADYPAHERRKTPLRARVLGLFYPQLTHDEANAIARWMEVSPNKSVVDVCAAVTAINKALTYRISHYGESKEEVAKILTPYLARAAQALARGGGPRPSA